MAGNSVGQINLDLGINQKGFKKEMSGLAGPLGKLGKLVVAAFSVKAVTSFAKECLKLGSDLQEVQNVVDVTFGDMSGKVNDFAKSAMTAYGLSEKTAKEYMGQFGAMSKAFGNTTEAAYDQSEALTALTGDVASFYNLSTDEAFTKLKAVYTGETEALKSLGVVMTQTALDEFAMAQGMGKTTKQMTEQEKVSLRLAFVTDRLSAASGDFARTSDGWANQTRVLGLRFDALKASIGQGLINVFTPVIKLLNTFVAKLQVAADAFANFTTALFGDAGGSGAATFGAAAESAGGIQENIEGAAGDAAKLKKSLMGFDKLNVISSPDSGGGGGGAGGAGGGATTATPITPTVESVNIASGAADALKSWIDTLPKLKFDVDWATVKTNVTKGFQNLWSSVQQWTHLALTISINIFNDLGIDTLITKLSDLWLAFSEFQANVTEVLTPALTTFYETAISPIVTWIGEKLADAVQTVSDLFTSWGQWFTDNSQSIQDFTTYISDAVSGIWDFLEPIGDTAWETFKGLIEKISDFFQDFFQWIIDNKEVVVAAVTGITTALLAYKAAVGISNLIKLFKSGVIATTIAEKTAAVAQWALNAAMNANPIALIVTLIAGLVAAFIVLWNNCEGFRDFFIKMWETIKTSVTNVINGILGGIEGFVNGILKGVNFLIRGINKISFEVPEWVPVIGGKTLGFNLKELDMVTLPRLATGGYVAANTPQLAVIGDNKHEGEIVAPESKIAEAVARGFAMVMSKMQQPAQSPQRSSATPVIIKIGETDFWRGFIDFHNSEVARTGESPLLI